MIVTRGIGTGGNLVTFGLGLSILEEIARYINGLHKRIIRVFLR